MPRVSRTEKTTNESILMETGQTRGYMSLRQKEDSKTEDDFFGHEMRANGLEKEMMLSRGEGRRKRGRLRKRWMEEIHTMPWMDLAEMRDTEEDRGLWRRMTMTVVRIQWIDGTR